MTTNAHKQPDLFVDLNDGDRSLDRLDREKSMQGFNTPFPVPKYYPDAPPGWYYGVLDQAVPRVYGFQGVGDIERYAGFTDTDLYFGGSRRYSGTISWRSPTPSTLSVIVPAGILEQPKVEQLMTFLEIGVGLAPTFVKGKLSTTGVLSLLTPMASRTTLHLHLTWVSYCLV